MLNTKTKCRFSEWLLPKHRRSTRSGSKWLARSDGKMKSSPLLTLETLEDRTLLSAGALDLTFNGTGSVSIPFTLGGNNAADATAVAIQSDKKIVVVGQANSTTGMDFAVARLNLDGTLDTTFGTGGKFNVNFNGGGLNTDFANAVAIQPDGKIVIAGQGSASGSSKPIALARLNTNGTLDSTFGNGGLASIASPSGIRTVNALAIQPDGKFVVGGAKSPTTSNGRQFVARVLADGSGLDTSFNTTGSIDYGFSLDTVARDEVKGIVLQPDGSIIAAGFAQVGATTTTPTGINNFTAVRILTLGTLDPTFGTGGKFNVSFNLDSTGPNDDEATGVVFQPDGKIVLGGFASVHPSGGVASKDFVALRLNTNGTLDSTFGTNGLVTNIGMFSGANPALARGVGLESDGKIVLAGTVQNPTLDSAFAAARLNPNGTLDNSFGAGGKVLYADATVSGAFAVAIPAQQWQDRHGWRDSRRQRHGYLRGQAINRLQ